MSRISVVIGKNFGDEGKGLVTDFLCKDCDGALVIKHNGGAQAGHTVDRIIDGCKQRFVFHQLSSGSFRNGETFWAKTYFPDLYKLGEEREQFQALTGFAPNITCDRATNMVIIDDVIVNMALETMRGAKRHGSCGMGINESYLRTEAGWGVNIYEAISHSAVHLTNRLREIRRDYVWPGLQSRVKELNRLPGEYYELLTSDQVLANVADEILKNSEMISFVEKGAAYTATFEQVVFESGQGLLLDACFEKYAPHLTTSRTGLNNPVAICDEWNLKIDEVYYVTRSYMTRHGAGPLEHECAPKQLGEISQDITNVTNPWQGQLRYGKHSELEAFVEPVKADMRNAFVGADNADNKKTVEQYDISRRLVITHLNETKNRICMAQGDQSLEAFVNAPQIRECFAGIYGSDTPYAENIKEVTYGQKH